MRPSAPLSCSPDEVAGALGEARAVGSYFDWSLYRDRAAADDGGTSDGTGNPWRPMSAFTAGPELMVEQVAAFRTFAAGRTGLPTEGIQERVAASSVSLGLFAQLISPAFATATLTGIVPALTLDALWWQPVSYGPWPIAFSPVPGAHTGGDPEVAAELIISNVIEPVVAPMVAAFSGLSRIVLWSNVASAVGGALGALAWSMPEQAEAGSAIAKALAGRGPLAGTGEFLPPEPGSTAWTFRRTSCCMYYRMPGGALCGDCVLHNRPRRSA